MGEASQSPAPPNSGRAQEGIASSSAVYPVCSHSQSLPSGSNQAPQAPTGHYQQFAFSSQFEMPPYQNGGGPYNMGHMASSLPQGNYRLGEAKFSGHQMMTHLTHMGQMGQHFYVPHPAQMAAGYYAPVSPSQQQARLPSQPAAYYGAQMATGNPQSMGVAYYCYPPPGLYHPPAHDHLALQPVSNGQPHGPVRRHRSLQAATTSSPSCSRKGSGDVGDRQGLVRGPPRKPKQSGHAIWIGNLPPHTDLMQLVHHVCREAKGLQSLFLISKSNCAFSNFKDEESCLAAQQKLHNSQFQTVRLVSRLRKSTVEGTAGQTAPIAPAAALAATNSSNSASAGTFGCSSGEGSSQSVASQDKSEATSPNGDDDGSHNLVVSAVPVGGPSQSGDPQAYSGMQFQPRTSPAGGIPRGDRFFILKSLTIDDLDRSVRTGIWATQAHNEQTLNIAFQSGGNVYLIFSANKSGEYFGYARMTSEINADPAAAIEFAPKVQSSSDVDLPRAIPTDATEFAPKGRIIDDSARGTIFWEAEKEFDSEERANEEAQNGGDSSSAKSDGEEQKAWGKPFSLEWISTSRLPFYRTRGLRNPWNSNREVKIARDGTEIEPSIGRRLIGLFNRVQSPPPAGMGLIHGMTGYPPPQAGAGGIRQEY